MTVFNQLVLLFSVCLFSKAICLLLPFDFPTSVMGMLVMLVLLTLKIVKLEQIKETSEFLLANMAFFFIPAGVSIIEHYDKVQGKVLVLLLICLLSTVITFAATAYVITFIVKLQNKRKQAVK